MKWRWVAVSVVVAGAALAASWGMGFWDTPAPTEDAAPARKAPPDRAQMAPLGAVAVALSHSRPAPSPAQRPDDPEGCCSGAEPCADDAVCIDGGCVSTVCVADGGPDARCVLPGGRVGSCCGERCADLETDGAHCGRCGAKCEGGLDCVSGYCRARSCVGRMAGTPCGDSDRQGGGCCRGACVDSATWADDAANCGGCGHACAPGLTCKQGACTDPATGEPPAWTCVDPGHACPPGFFCVIDACLPQTCNGDGDGLLCPMATGRQVGHCCAGSCIDLFADSSNCRACGLRCAPGQACKNGECEAPGP